MHRLAFFLIATVLQIHLAYAQIKPRARTVQVQPVITNRVVIIDQKEAGVYVTNKDTIPLGRNKYYKIDEVSNARYLNTSFNKDSVKQEKAAKTDWDEFAKAYTNLQCVIKENPFDNVRNYIDTGKDFIELQLLNPDFFPNTAKVCIRQLTFNLLLLNQIISKPLPEKADVQLLGSVMNNIDVLINKYVATKGTTMTIKSLLLPNVSIKVFDKTGAELTQAKCYFISFKTCRDIACRTCVPGLDPCDETNINAISSKPDAIFDCTNPAKIRIDYGHYYFFVISNSKIRYYDKMHFDENSLSSTGDKEIKINLP